MGEAKWVKFLVGMFDDPKLKIINSMDERDSICYVWVRCILLAGSCNENGLLCINDTMPYTLEILAIEFNRPVDVIAKALEVLINLQMIEKTDEGILRVKNWAKHQNAKALEKLKKDNAARVAKWRAKKKAQSKIDKNDKDNKYETCDELESQNEDAEAENTEEHTEENTEKDITCNESNITVIKSNGLEEREIKIEDNNKNKTEERNIEKENCTLENSVRNLTEYFKSNSKDKKGINTTAIKYAILKHNVEYVKLAIDKSILAGKSTMTYVNGILKNWVNEGYPDLNEGENTNGGKRYSKDSRNNTDEYGIIKKKKPREISEYELQHAECELI